MQDKPVSEKKHSQIRRNEASIKGPSAFVRGMRIFAAISVLVLLLVSIALGSVWLLLQGRSGEDSVLTSQIKSSIEDALGPEYEVLLRHTDIDLTSIGNVQARTKLLEISRRSDDASIASIQELQVAASWLNYFSGNGAFDTLTISGLKFDAESMSSGQVGLPAQLEPAFDGVGARLKDLSTAFTDNGFKKIRIEDSVISGLSLGRRISDPFEIRWLDISKDSSGSLRADGDFSTLESRLALKSIYSTSGDAAGYEFSLDGLSLLEWLPERTDTQHPLSLDSRLGLSGRLMFDLANGNARDPKLLIEVKPGTLGLGLEGKASLNALKLDLELFLDRNQIELKPSHADFGSFAGSLVGGVKPANEELGYHGPLRYDFIVEHSQMQPVLESEPLIPAAFQVGGVFYPKERKLDASKIVFTTEKGAVTGSAKIDLNGETPAVRGELETSGISILAIKHYWPFFVSPAARDWVHQHVYGGWISKGKMFADIPAGIIFRLRNGAKLTSEQYKVSMDVSDLSFLPFGEMPRIRRAKGQIAINGMTLSATVTEGEAADENNKLVKIRSGSFTLPDFAAQQRVGETNLEFTGDAQTIARISNRKPLRVMERMDVSANQFAGKGHADIAVRFPMGRKIEYEEVDWNVLLDLTNAKSSKAFEGRIISDANLLIDANPKGANVTGTARIDGVKSKIRITQPIGKSGAVKPKRVVISTLTDKDREKLGFDLDPVISGPLTIKIERTDGVERHNVDFTKAEISMPWIGWRKGAGIKANGQFDFTSKNNRFVLNNFKLASSGFSAAGKLVFDKRGIISADLINLKLNEGDNISLKVKRAEGAYNINATGLSFDGRSILNTLIHAGEFSEAQGGRSVNLVANFDKIIGFNNRIMRNAILLYESRNGRLSRLDMSAVGSEGRKYSVNAQLKGSETVFTMSTNDAGNALAFVDVYSKMQGGSLNARLVQSDKKPFVGPVRVTNFQVVNEPRLARMASNVTAQVQTERGGSAPVFTEDTEKIVKFQLADAQIERGSGYLNVRDAIIRSGSMGLTINGSVYDEADRMNISGTFMPANGINMAVSAIPLLGQLFSNGRDNALIGITYQLKGARKNPELSFNPLSIVAPGVFNKVFEFKQ